MKNKITTSDVKLIRDAMGLSRRLFAAELGISERIVYTWEKASENGEVAGIHPNNAAAIAKLKRKHLGR
jgi:DNA-binding transcriptional regulator YiaG